VAFVNKIEPFLHSPLSNSGSIVVKALCHKPEGRGIETPMRWMDFFFQFT
jgi:hypothetical protein